MQPEKKPKRSRFLLHFVVFFVFLSLWTWKLLEPHPVPDEISDVGQPCTSFKKFV